MLMPGRSYKALNAYRFGFNGKQNDNDLKGEGNLIDYGARFYDARIGRWMSVEPKSIKYPELSPYTYVANSPIKFIDYDGRDFGVEVIDNTIIIKMNVYTINEKTTTEAQKAADELNQTNATVEIDGVTLIETCH